MVGSWVTLGSTISVWAALQVGDLWVPATVLMFGPRWLLLVPSVILLLAAVTLRRRSLRVIVPTLLVAAGPVMGFSIPWSRRGDEPPALVRVRVLTCNMHYSKVDPGPLDRLIDSTAPDVVAIQEWRDSARSAMLAKPGWHSHRIPGLFLASRYPVRRAEQLGLHSADERGSVMRYELELPAGPMTVFSLHFASPREGLGIVASGSAAGWNEVSANSRLRWAQSEHVAAEAGQVAGPVILVGDFNTPTESVIFREVWAGYEDAFTSAGWGWGNTFLISRTAVRIDHILVGGGGRAIGCRVGPDVGSPHRPVLADVAWP